jgi:predicted transcriptional regulator
MTVISLPDDLERQLHRLAAELKVPVEELAAAAVRDLLARPGPEFEEAAKLVLAKNSELYRRLA